MVAGALAAAVGQTWLAHISTGSSYVWHVLPPSLLLGIGIGLLTVPVAATATANVTEQQTGLASGLLDTANQVGGALGLACLATIAAASSSGYLPAMLAAAAIFTTAGAAALLTPRRPRATAPGRGTQAQTMMVE